MKDALDPENDEALAVPTHRQVVRFWLGIAAACLSGLAVLVVLNTTDLWEKIEQEHFAAVIGAAAAASLFIVLILTSSSGPIEFEAISFKFRGAAGPLIFWVIVYLAIVVGIKILW